MPGVASASPLRVDLLSAVSADETFSVPVNVASYQNLTFYVTGTGTINAGVITIEEAYWDPDKQTPYGGTWGSVTTMNASDVTAGATKAIHLTAGCYAWLHARISTAVGGGGSVSISLVAN